MEKFLLLKYEYVELFKLLKLVDWVSSGGEAKMVVEEGKVKVNGETETRKRKKLRIGDRVTFGDKELMINRRR